MKADHTRRLIGGAASLFGLWWVWLSVHPFVQGIFTGDNETSDFVFLFTIVPLMVIPGVLAVVFGVRLFIAMSESSLKWVVGVFAVFGAFWLSSRLSEGFPDLLPEGLRDFAFLFVSSVVAIPAYLFVVRLLYRHFTNQDRTCTSLLSRGVLVLMAWQLWFLLSSVFEEYSPKEGFTYIDRHSWDLLGFLGPIIVAYASYRIFAALLLPKGQKGAAEQDAIAGESK